MRISDWSSDVCSSDLLTGWVTVANGGVTSFPNAQLNVIAGRLNKLYSPPLPRSTPGPLHLRCWPMDTTSTHPRWGLPPVEQGYGGMMADAAENIVVTAQRRSVYAPPPPPPPPPPAPAMAPPEDLGDLKYYRLPFRVDVSATGQKQVALLAKDAVPVGQLYAATLTNQGDARPAPRTEEHTSELQSLMRLSSAVFFLTKK